MEGRSRAKVPEVPGWGICTWVLGPKFQVPAGSGPTPWGVGSMSRSFPGAHPRVTLVVVRGNCWCLGLGSFLMRRKLWALLQGSSQETGSTGCPVEACGHPWAMKVYENIYISILPLAALVSWYCCSGYGSWILNEWNWENISNNDNNNFVSYKIHIESTMNDTTDLSSNSRNQSHFFFTSLRTGYARSHTFKPFSFGAHPAFSRLCKVNH